MSVAVSTVMCIMLRRTQLFYRDLDQGLGAAPAVADRMAHLIGWDDAQREASLEAYRQDVALARKWRAGLSSGD